jgi:hypothetical protein
MEASEDRIEENEKRRRLGRELDSLVGKIPSASKIYKKELEARIAVIEEELGIRPSHYSRPRSNFGRRIHLGAPRVRMGVWLLVGIWLLGTAAVAQLSLLPDSPVWYLFDVIGAVAGIWFGFKYFRWVERAVHSSGNLFLVTIGSFILFPIVGGFVLGLYPLSTCSTFWSLPGCQGVYVQTFGPFAAPKSMAGYINSVISLTAPLALIILLAALYGAYRLSHTVFVR